MKVVIQKVKRSSVTVDNKLVNREIRDLNGTLRKIASGKFLAWESDSEH